VASFSRSFGPGDELQPMRPSFSIHCAATGASSVMPAGKKETSILRSLMPHLRRAVLLHSEVARYPHAFILTDGECRILYINAAGRETARRNDGVTIETGRVLLMLPSEHRAFQHSIREITEGKGLPVRRIEASRRSGAAPYSLLPQCSSLRLFAAWHLQARSGSSSFG